MKMGIWLNQRDAYIVKVFADREIPATVEHVRSHVEGMHKATHGTRSKNPFMQRSSTAGFENKLKERRDHELHHFFGDIIPKLANSEQIVIFGPGQIGVKLRKAIDRIKELEGRGVEVRPADQMTERQMVAETLMFFHRPPRRKIPGAAAAF